MLRISSFSALKVRRRCIAQWPTTDDSSTFSLPRPSRTGYSTTFPASAEAEKRSEMKILSKQELHELRVSRDQSAAAQRKQQRQTQHVRENDTKQEQAQQHHQQKQTHHSVSMSIEHWLVKDPNFFEATMDTLGVGSTKSDLWEQYRSVFKESIISYRKILVNKEQLPKDLLDAIDKLSQAGFGDVQQSKLLNSVRGAQVKKQEINKRIAKLENERKAFEELLQLEKFSLASLQNDLENLREEDDEVTVDNDQNDKNFPPNIEQEKVSFRSNFAQAMDLFTDLWKPGDSGKDMSLQAEIKTVKISKKKRRLNWRIHKKNVSLEGYNSQIESINTLIELLKKEERDIKTPMSIEKYNESCRVVESVRDVICRHVAEHIKQRHAELIHQYQTLNNKTDLTKPHEWFSYARLDKRRIIMHAGPTNSGKTYTALQRLIEAKKGLYVGPLRLLAAEVYEQLTSEGVYCNLYTGQETRKVPFSTHSSATVEMTSLEEEFDVAVIDEIQMLSDNSRGAAWTRALLGLRCKEIHVCGGMEARNIVETLARACGDSFELRRYERFRPLVVEKKSFAKRQNTVGCYRNVQPGDCIVSFSRDDLFAIKREIESTTDFRCCVIYGSLPPAIRTDQARLFNDPESGYDILVASDAIGMGLNLNIRRIVFNSIFKFNGEEVARLRHSEVKQISGRAGRRNSPFPQGYVTCRDPRDLAYIQWCLSTEIQPLSKAGLLPTASHIKVFSDAFLSTSLNAGGLQDIRPDLYKILRQFSSMATVQGGFFLCGQSEMQDLAKKLSHIPLPLEDLYTLCLSSAGINSFPTLESFAKKLSAGQVCGLPSHQVPSRAGSFDQLTYLCNIYNNADLFLWLQKKFPPGNVFEEQAALSRKEQAIQFINIALENSEELELNHCYVEHDKSQRLKWESKHGVSPDPRDNLYDGTEFSIFGTSDAYESDEGESPEKRKLRSWI